MRASPTVTPPMARPSTMVRPSPMLRRWTNSAYAPGKATAGGKKVFYHTSTLFTSICTVCTLDTGLLTLLVLAGLTGQYSVPQRYLQDTG